MGKIKFSVKNEDDISIVTISGEVFSPDVPTFDENLGEVIDSSNKIIIDFSRLNYLCSAAIGCLIGYFNQAQQKGGKIVITRMNDKLKKVLDRIGFPSIIEITETVDEAKTLFWENIE